jgi:hypothetical protein
MISRDERQGSQPADCGLADEQSGNGVPGRAVPTLPGQTGARHSAAHPTDDRRRPPRQPGRGSGRSRWPTRSSSGCRRLQTSNVSHAAPCGPPGSCRWRTGRRHSGRTPSRGSRGSRSSGRPASREPADARMAFWIALSGRLRTTGRADVRRVQPPQAQERHVTALARPQPVDRPDVLRACQARRSRALRHRRRAGDAVRRRHVRRRVLDERVDEHCDKRAFYREISPRPRPGRLAAALGDRRGRRRRAGFSHAMGEGRGDQPSFDLRAGTRRPRRAGFEIVERGENPPHRSVALVHRDLTRDATANSGPALQDGRIEPIEVLARQRG